MSEGESIQCPKCGGYKIMWQDRNSGGKIALRLLTGGFSLIGEAISNQFRTVKNGDKLECGICGYIGVWRNGTW
jgi:DNA-directed RNA polymerase subunit RPC12/RpoP